ncbi:MAG: hypothetical protein P8Y67_07160 [Alphaproteobacteria bacterium]
MLNEKETDDTESLPPPPLLSPKQILALKIAIGVMTLLIVLGVILLIVGMLHKLSEPPGAAARIEQHKQTETSLPLMGIPLKHGAQVKNVMADHGKLVVHLHGEKGDEIYVIDLATGWQQQRIVISTPR